MRCLCITLCATLCGPLSIHSRPRHWPQEPLRSLRSLESLRSDHAVVRTVTANRRNRGAPRGAGEETGSSPGHACLLTEAHGNCSPRASSYSPRTMHLGAEQQPPTAPATEAAHPAFPASRAVFRGCFSPASSGRHLLAAAAASRVPDAAHLALALVVSSRDASHPAPASTSVVCRTPLSSSLVSSRLVSSLSSP
ncbi:hypothetical protein NDU88_001895 [Pleurodeles waltl]|uniref:Secreted protein n=1 Tax=Pleurodeles waltl TaxID=8319 RepID=A0AAV7M0X3_PLEWA|nr:hypothetical protein NDU88_001895 [Pleurodeles waltl]